MVTRSVEWSMEDAPANLACRGGQLVLPSVSLQAGTKGVSGSQTRRRRRKCSPSKYRTVSRSSRAYRSAGSPARAAERASTATTAPLQAALAVPSRGGEVARGEFAASTTPRAHAGDSQCSHARCGRWPVAPANGVGPRGVRTFQTASASLWKEPSAVWGVLTCTACGYVRAVKHGTRYPWFEGVSFTCLEHMHAGSKSAPNTLRARGQEAWRRASARPGANWPHVYCHSARARCRLGIAKRLSYTAWTLLSAGLGAAMTGTRMNRY